MSWPKGKPRGATAEIPVGARFNRLTVLERDFDKVRRVHWKCICDCGIHISAAACDVKSGHTKSCGCANQESRVINNTKHGKNRTPTYVVWSNMLARCTNPNLRDYKNYGGRGITICDQWRTFEGFFADMGERPDGLTLERIDVDGNYDPANCKWATPKEQANNWRKSIRATYMGKSYTAMQLSEMLNVSHERVVWAIKRYREGWHDYIVRAAAEIGKNMK